MNNGHHTNFLSRAHSLPLHGALNPGVTPGVTTPGCFANAPDVGGPLAFSSPDTPGMPAASAKTAWDFLPEGWSAVSLGKIAASSVEPGASATGQRCACEGATADPREVAPGHACPNCLGDLHQFVEFTTARGERTRVIYTRGFTPITQLEHARLGVITPQMRRVAQREPHFEKLFPGRAADAVRDEVAAGRMVIPANVNHLRHRLDPMGIGRACVTKINANLGASPVSSGTHEEIEKLEWAIKWGADTAMDLSTGGNIDE